MAERVQVGGLQTDNGDPQLFDGAPVVLLGAAAPAFSQGEAGLTAQLALNGIDGKTVFDNWQDFREGLSEIGSQPVAALVVIDKVPASRGKLNDVASIVPYYMTLIGKDIPTLFVPILGMTTPARHQDIDRKADFDVVLPLKGPGETLRRAAQVVTSFAHAAA